MKLVTQIPPDYYSGNYKLKPIGLNRPRFQANAHLKNMLMARGHAGRGGSNMEIDLRYEVSNSKILYYLQFYMCFAAVSGR